MPKEDLSLANQAMLNWAIYYHYLITPLRHFTSIILL